MPINTIIPTPHLLLKPFTPSDIHHLFNTLEKADIMQTLGVDEEGYNKYQIMHEQGMECYRVSMLFFLLIEKETNLPIGQCGFHTWNKNHQRAELFYILHHDLHKQKGYMKEALPFVLSYGFTEMNLHRIEALLDPNNTPSLKLLLQNNFTREGSMREDYIVDGVHESSDCYSLLHWEWEKNGTSHSS